MPIFSMHISKEISKSTKPVSRRCTRRKSVFTESFDPNEEPDDVEYPEFPKTLEQRERLLNAVKDVLLFRNLEPEQMNQVLSAMFERTVLAGDTIIQQGADGDNFYVIES